MSKIFLKNSASEINSYSVNLLWVNKTKDFEQKYLYPNKFYKEKLFHTLTKWGKANPTAKINLWFDSEMHDKNAILKSQELFNETFQASQLTNISLKDIRDIKVVKENPVLFTQDIDIYFRVDLLKLIVCWQQMKEESFDSAIFSDLEVGDFRTDKSRMDKAELFDQDSMIKLEKFGMINNFGKYTERENQFIQILNNESSVSTLETMINVCLMRGVENLNLPQEKQQKLLKNLSKAPFYATIYEFSKYYMATKSNSVEVKASVVGDVSENEWIKFDPKKHGYTPFGNVFYSGGHNFEFEDFSKTPSLRIEDPIKFGIKNSDISGGNRETNTRDGNDHNTYPTLPEEGHPKFLCHFIGDEEVTKIEDEISNMGLSPEF